MRAAAEAQTAAREAYDKATRDLHREIRKAKKAGAGEGQLAEVSGLTRQRVWQITRDKQPA